MKGGVLSVGRPSTYSNVRHHGHTIGLGFERPSFLLAVAGTVAEPDVGCGVYLRGMPGSPGTVYIMTLIIYYHDLDHLQTMVTSHPTYSKVC